MSGSGGSVGEKRGVRKIAVKAAVLASLVVAYRLSFSLLHGVIGNPAFLLGLLLCVVAAAWLGLRGALVVIVVVALIDRSFALSLTGPETGRAAAVIALLVKLVLAGGLGLVMDSRRRVSALNAQLRHEMDTRKQHEESLRRSEQLHRELERELQRSQALQSLAVMAGGVAHDFNNLLCGVVGNAEVAKRKVPAGAPAVLSQCLSEITAFANEAAQLSKQMLAYAGRQSLGIEALDSNAELAASLRLLHATVESKARLALDLAKCLPEVSADRFQLRQVVTNLVLNALDAMEGKRGILTLRTESVRLEGDGAQPYALSAGDYVKITVEDTGSGIPVEARERLFEPFFSTKGPGRGMGLAAAAGIVRAHRGWLGIDTTSEHGTRFGMLLPVAHESTPRRTSAVAAPTAAPTARNILLIDDERAVRVVTGRLLNELGHRVMTANSGQSGLELFRKQPEAIDLVVLDLTMPERSGAEILDELRLVRDDVPVIITSGFQATDASKLLSVPNVIAFLDKPHTLANLELVVASVDSRAPGASAMTAAS
jgi:two-component system, cell cycle sensor histidine kinase and response regulator CckA